MKFSIRMSEHDRGYRVKRIQQFLTGHDTVLLTVTLKGREQQRPDLALNVLASLVAELEKVGKPSGPPLHKGRVVQVLILPK